MAVRSFSPSAIAFAFLRWRDVNSRFDYLIMQLYSSAEGAAKRGLPRHLYMAIGGNVKNISLACCRVKVFFHSCSTVRSGGMQVAGNVIPKSSAKRSARSRIVSGLRRELMGPTDPNEVLKEYPTTRYIAGKLAPSRINEHDMDAEISEFENDSLASGIEDDEAGEESATPPLIIGFSPSSMGLSFLVESNIEMLSVHVEWGDYRRIKGDDSGTIWQRYPKAATVSGISLKKLGTLPAISISPLATNPAGVTVTGADEPEITIEGVVHSFAGYHAVSLFLVNRRSKGQQGDRTKDERWIFQPEVHVRAEDGEPVFVAKDFGAGAHEVERDSDSALNNLLYRHAREFATGHGVAVDWDEPVGDGSRTTGIRTEFMPRFEVPILIAPSEETGQAVLDMKDLSEIATSQKLVKMLEPMVKAYENWIETEIVLESQQKQISGNAQLAESAKANLENCRTCAKRMRKGLELLEKDPLVFQSFQFANRAMWDQRIHSIWASHNRKRGLVEGSPADFDVPRNRTWRPFQMGFILLNVEGLVSDESVDRRTVDLLWFPTGGGKTEAYLGLSAFVMGLRRLRGEQHGLDASAGVSIIMRYTLRLLTVQQFQRAAALVAACESARRKDQKWGAEPFRIGLWVGRGTTPNSFPDSLKALEDINEGKKPREGSPVQLVSCPRCGTILVTEKGVPESQTYIADNDRKRTLICCRNPECEFTHRNSNGEGLPVVVVDSEIYRMRPTIIIATVDKFARMPFKGETQALFGFRDRYSPTFGHLTQAHGDTVEGRKVKDAQSRGRLLPPELIIQDELHLISGPLGTLVGLYETAVDYLTGINVGNTLIVSKVIASTATIKRARQQVGQLYGREIEIFPPSALSAKDSFFAKELTIDDHDDDTAGRLYLGINAPGSSTKTLLVRVYAALLSLAQAEIDSDPKSGDPYGTLVGYFNSLRALGGAKRLVEDDVAVRLRYLNQQQGLPLRKNLVGEELTSRLDSWKIPGLLKKLDFEYPRGKSDWPVDTLLATNMISVGVDIDRLGVMAVTGQPKSSAEYIQATSRVGRKHPGLVVTMYNWMGARDLSHYERFHSYHAALYRFVEAISVTPFSSRALDRGLRAIFVAMARLAWAGMAREPEAQNFDGTESQVASLIDYIVERAQQLVGSRDAELVRRRLLSHKDEWSMLAQDLLRYCWLDDTRPPNNSRVLLKTAGSTNDGEWLAPGSLREVEPSAAFYLLEGDD